MATTPINSPKAKRRILNSQSTGKVSRGAVEDTIKGVHLIHADDGWAVKTNGVRGRVELFEDGTKAAIKARLLARRRGTRVFVHDNPSDEIECLIRQSKLSSDLAN